ncbi:intradiol ring-cleavage dioxygenase [Nonomuraea aridisoli]|uniref:Protocatechuate dioxygenase n=1 Tax=Nonomuraea aridisoli TaxID=2070368 RepID=A0A2W2E8Z0_9ACTN|nr:intradiol ring-cleavage dioxygenase [Nonomuraea aridisoli]PZG18861.1 protocatechuate dioxygenase [Nonomuraea aridisoli]
MGHDHEGQRVSRRRLITGVSSIGLGGLLAACAKAEGTTTVATAAITPRAATAGDVTALFAEARTCRMTADVTQGPFYFDADLVRSDIREGRPGVRLRVAIKVQDGRTCRPLPNAVVEIWHCDANGLYSGAEALSAAGPLSAGFKPLDNGEFADMKPADGTRYLRGAQVTNADGIVEFTTVWPGWYHGRTIHIHAMVHIADQRALTTQLMFDETLNREVMATRPYARRTGRTVFNEADEDFDPSMLMKTVPDGDGYLSAITLST